MNFLAHLYLSGKSDQLMIGNFIGDFVKGKEHEHFSEEIRLGVTLHRAIDEYTDLHEVVGQSKDKLRKKYRHYSGVIVDMFYDHFLAVNWSTYSDQKLEEFAQNSYSILQTNLKILPRRAQHMLPFMIEGNWLVKYSKLEGLQKALNGMTRRTTFQSKMNEAIAELQLHYKTFDTEFNLFFPDLISFCEDWRKEHGLDS